MTLPVVLEQNHIAVGDKTLFPFGKSRKCKHFRAGGSLTLPYRVVLFEIFKFQFIEQYRYGNWSCVSLFRCLSCES